MHLDEHHELGLLAETGVRVGELCWLRLDDVDLGRGVLQVRLSAWRWKLGDPKTEESIRVVELSPQACEQVRAFLKSWCPNNRRMLFAMFRLSTFGCLGVYAGRGLRESDCGPKTPLW
jgi:integrase